MKKLFKAIGAALVVATIATPATSQPLKQINVSYVTSPFNLQVIVTKKHNLLEKEFEKDGITVKWHGITSGAKQAQAMAAGSLDVGMVMNSTSVLMANAAGNPIKIIAGVSRPSETFALVSNNPAVTSFADLKGKKVAGPKGTVLHQFLGAGLEKAGLSFNDVDFISMGLPKARSAMLSGNVDGALLAASLVIKSQEQGAHVVSTATGLVTPKLVVAAAAPFVEANPQVVARVVKVHQQAQKWIDENYEAAIELGAKEKNISVADAKKLAAWAGFTTKLNADDIASMNDDKAFLLRNDLIKQDIDVAPLFASTVLEETK
ncbi:ABC transporter substrate-binding protein [Polycladidibacter stylochi]|uniref:ABC transporter substrate-binding protein n=1 Tax=Polycladidibacter stylochi TaxID=1807766 RepID=UPI00082A970A|nr:NrtA/SsuA/CpmA family ABC transporter substrate-binding protein [Pseudovibrio stylochi]